jgi:hypothetical protein
LASWAKLRCWVEKQVLISDHFCVFGSYIESWRCEFSSGAIFAEGKSDPFLQNSGFSSGRSWR